MDFELPLVEPFPFKDPPTNHEYRETTPITTYVRPPPMRLPEMNYNLGEYFYFDDVEGWSFFPRNELRYMIKNPEEESLFHGQKKKDGLYEIRNGVIKVGHLPNRLDLVQLPDGFQIFLNWAINGIDPESDDIIPFFARWILDPCPIIPTTGKIYLLREEPVDVVMGTYTDVVHVFHVMASMTDIKLTLYMLQHYDNPIRTYKATTAFFGGKSYPDRQPFPIVKVIYGACHIVCRFHS